MVYINKKSIIIKLDMLDKKLLLLICFSVLSCCSKQQKQEDVDNTPSPSVVSITSFSPTITEPTTEEPEIIFTSKIYLPRTEETKEGAREVTDCLIKDHFLPHLMQVLKDVFLKTGNHR